MSTQKEKLIVCKLYSVHTKDIISVSLGREKGGFAVLKRKNKDWYIAILRYKKKKWFIKVEKTTTFKRLLRYIPGYFINSKWQYISKTSFSNFNKIDYLDSVGIGWIPEQYLI